MRLPPKIRKFVATAKGKREVHYYDSDNFKVAEVKYCESDRKYIGHLFIKHKHASEPCVETSTRPHLSSRLCEFYIQRCLWEEYELEDEL